MLDTVTINQLRTFIAVCEEASFTGAGRRLLSSFEERAVRLLAGRTEAMPKPTRR